MVLYNTYKRTHHCAAKLSPAQRDEIRIRYADGESGMSLALEFGVSTRTIYANTSPRPNYRRINGGKR